VAELSRAQLHVAVAFFALPDSAGFVLVGGAALLALELIDRPTEDLDFFTDDPTRIANAVKELSASPTIGTGQSR
jgi:Nucleotidyl transferase AbiEii toxin, Type IV TA system